MGPVRVVVIDVVDDKLVELAAVPDDGAVKEFASKGADPAFGERVRHGGAHRCLEDLVLRLSSTRRWCRELNQLWQALGRT